MAATIGATLGTVAFPLRHAGMGPFKSSAGNIYWFGRDTTNTGTIEPHKATDPMTSFTAGTQKTMSSGTTTAIEAGACYQVADVIHIATQISTGATYYNSFNMATDAWTLTTSETAVAAASFAPTTGYTFVSLVVRSGGEVVIACCAGLTAMSSGFNMVRGTRRTGTNTYSALATNIDNGGSVNWSNPIAILGASDRVHFFFKSMTGGTAFQRTLSSANALETFPASFAVTSTGAVHTNQVGASWISGASTKVAIQGYFAPSGTTTPRTAVLTSADVPTVSISSGRNIDAGQVATNDQIGHILAVSGSTLHVLGADSTLTDLQHDVSSDEGGTWGTDVNELAGTITSITSNVYDRSGTKLATVVNDGGTIKYAEIDIATVAATVEQVIHRSRSGYIYY